MVCVCVRARARVCVYDTDSVITYISQKRDTIVDPLQWLFIKLVYFLIICVHYCHLTVTSKHYCHTTVMSKLLVKLIRIACFTAISR